MRGTSLLPLALVPITSLILGDPAQAQVEQTTYIKAPNTDGGDTFGLRMAASGNTLVVGAPYENSAATGVNGDMDDDSASGAGAAYVFVNDGTGWALEAYLKASNTETADNFGSNVAIDGDTIVIGAPYEDSDATAVGGDETNNDASRQGAAYVFERTAGVWSQTAYLKASNGEEEDEFGVSVAVSGNLIAVGAMDESSAATGVDGNEGDNSASQAGAVYVFRRSGVSWIQEAYLKASNTDAFDRFGELLALDGEVLVVASVNEASAATGVGGNATDNTASQAGAAYVYRRTAGTWSQEAYLKASNTDEGDAFGIALAVSGNRIAVGAPNEGSAATGVGGDQLDESADSAGAVYLFQYEGGSWASGAYVKASNTDPGDRFGSAIALTDTSLLIGALGESSSATGTGGDQHDNTSIVSGAAYLFVPAAGSWIQTDYLKASNTDISDGFGGALALGTHALVVSARSEDSAATGFDGDQLDNSAPSSGAAYSFDLDLGVGQPYCVSTANSTGSAAMLLALGSTSVGANDLLLTASPVPDQPGLFYYGPDQILAPFGNGFRCVGGVVGRLAISNAMGGSLVHALDITQPPTAAVTITAGSTWNFQAWYRDPAGGGASFNLSDGLEVTFVP